MNDTMNAKRLVCAYCESSGAKCESCEINPSYSLNFQLSRSARTAIDKGVLTEGGALKMMQEINAARYRQLNALFDKEADDGQRDTKA